MNRRGEPHVYVYFSTNGVLSVMAHMSDGSAVEVGTPRCVSKGYMLVYLRQVPRSVAGNH